MCLRSSQPLEGGIQSDAGHPLPPNSMLGGKKTAKPFFFQFTYDN
jgi:hypothetical protein